MGDIHINCSARAVEESVTSRRRAAEDRDFYKPAHLELEEDICPHPLIHFPKMTRLGVLTLEGYSKNILRRKNSVTLWKQHGYPR